jgi:hypothetical protein
MRAVETGTTASHFATGDWALSCAHGNERATIVTMLCRRELDRRLAVDAMPTGPPQAPTDLHCARPDLHGVAYLFAAPPG